MGVIKVDPFRGMDNMVRRVNEVFDEINRGGIRLEVGDFAPRVDIIDAASSVTLHAELPGIAKENVKITISDDNILTISGEKKRSEHQDNHNYMRVERSYGSFTRSFTLPDTVDTTSVTANFTDGVLTVTLTKKEPAKPKVQEVTIQ